jgi:hypothetical protein
MKKLIIIAVLVLFSAPALAQWVAEGQDPQLFPYGDTDTLPPDMNPTLAGRNRNVSHSWMVAAGGMVWSWGGAGTTYVRPEGGDYPDNRQSKLSYFTPGAGWVGAFGGTLSGGGATGPVGFNNGAGTALPTYSQGTRAGGVAATATASYVVCDAAATSDPSDADGDVKIAGCGGYPRWGSPMDIYNVTQDYWYAAGVNPDSDVYARGVQIGDKYYHLNGDGVAYDYTVFDLETETWSQGNLNAGLIKSNSWGYGTSVAVSNSGGTYYWQDFSTDTTTALTNNPATSDAGAEGVVWRDYYIQISAQGNVEYYDLTQGATGVWVDSGVPAPNPGVNGNAACVIGTTIYWSLHGTLGTDAEKGMLYSLDVSVLGVTMPLAGDVDGNGVVNGLDLTAVISAWDTVPCDALWDPDADLDGNGVVNGLDLTEVISNWTVAGAAAAEPESAKPGKRVGNVRKGSGK